MPVQSCRNWLCDCPTGIPDLPVENLSAEKPDFPYFLGWTWNRRGRFTEDGKWNQYYGYGCGQWCYSSVSQEEADLCAMQLEAECPKDPPPPGEDGTGPDDIDPGGGDGNPTFIDTYYSAERSCVFQCNNGDLFTYTLPAGAAYSHVSQADADAQAESICWKRGAQRKLCFGSPMVPGCLNTFYEHVFTVSGGAPPYNIQLDYSTAPNGFTLDSAIGYFSGYGTTAGLYNLKLSATDSNTPPTTIHKTFQFFLVEITTTALANGDIGTPYSDTLTADSAPAGAFWQISTGSLPNGLSLNGATGVISGTPTSLGTFYFTVALIAVSPIAGTICTKTLSIAVSSGSVPCGLWKSCSVDWGTRTLLGTVGNQVHWTNLPEGAYQLVFIDHVYQYLGLWWIFAWPTPVDQPVINYADNGVWALTGLPTQPVGFVDDPTGSADYLTYPMPGFHQDLPHNTNSISLGYAIPVGPAVGTPTFQVVQLQELSYAAPVTLVANIAPVSLVASRFRLTYGGNTTSALMFTDNAATVQGALNALPSIIADGGVVCAGALGTGMTITWNANGNRALVVPAITTMSPAYYADVVTTQNGTAVLPEIQTLTVAPWSTALINFPAQPAFGGGTGSRNLWDIVVFHHWFNVAIGSYAFNPPPWQMEDVGVVDAFCRNVCGPEAPTVAPTAVAGGAGNVEAGIHTWVVEFVEGGFTAPLNTSESGPSPSVSLNLAVNSQVNLSNIPIGPAGTTARYIFRTALGDSVPRYVGQIPNNVATVFTDNVSDATVGIANVVQPSSHFWYFEFVGVADPFAMGPPYSFYDSIWAGIKLTGTNPIGRYYPYPPRSFFGAGTYHRNANHGILYYDIDGVF